MAERGVVVVRPVWMKQAEEARVKDEEQKAAAAWAAFDATFKDVEKVANKEDAFSDSETDEMDKDVNRPIGPVDPSKCTAAGTGIGGGAACTAVSFAVVTKDFDGRKIPHGGAQIKVKIIPGLGVGGNEQEGFVKDNGDGTYAITYGVTKRGNYMVHVDCNGRPIMGSPFPVFFSAGSLVNGSLFNASGNTLHSSFSNGASQSMPNYSGTTSGLFSGMLGLISGILPGASGGAILPGLGASFGEVCRGYLNGQCGRNDCKFNHPPYNQLMAALAAGSTMGGLSQMPLGPSAAAMAAAQAIVAAQALQAHAAQAAQAQAQAQSALESCGQKIQEGSPTSSDQDKIDVLSRTLEVSNLSPLLTSENLRQLFNCFGTVTKCEIAGCKQLAYVEYSKPEEASAALELNKMEVNGQSLAVEMAKSLPLKKEPSGAVAMTGSAQHLPLPLMMQQAVAMQQLQFQQALIMQQSMASQQAASRAASMKSATEMASARAAEISKRLKADGDGNEEKASDCKSRSPSGLHAKSRSRSRSPIRYRRDRQSPSRTAVNRFQRDRRFVSPLRSHRRDRSCSRDQVYHYRDGRDNYQKYPGRRDWGRSRDQYSRNLHRRSRSPSRTKKSPRARSNSPRHCKERKASPKLHKEGHKSSRHSRHSRSISKESRQYVKDNEGVIKNKGEYSGKLEEHVDKFMVKATDLHQHLEVKEDNVNDKLIKLESCRKITKTKEEISKDNVKDKDGRRNSKSGDKNNCTNSSFRDKDCTNNVRVATKSDDMPKERKSAYDNEKDIKGKRRHTKGSIIVVDADIVKKKLHKKEKRRYDDDYELKEKMLQYREKKASDGKDEPKEKQQWRKESEIDPELQDAVKQHKKQRKKDEEDDDNSAKKLEKNKHGKRRVYDSSDDSLLEYADRGDSPLKEISAQQKRKYGEFSKSVSPSNIYGD